MVKPVSLTGSYTASVRLQLSSPTPKQNQNPFWPGQAAGEKLTQSKRDRASYTPLTNYEAISSEVQNSTNGGLLRRDEQRSTSVGARKDGTESKLGVS